LTPSDAERAAARISIRRYRPEDRAAVRRICADTGFLGQPIDPIFEDRELFADYLTEYYLRIEPDATFVCEIDGEVKGYLMGCCKPLLNQTCHALINLSIGLKAAYRYYARPYNTASRRFLRWIALNAWREIPAAPRFTPHLHINLLPETRSVKHTRLLIQSFLELVHQRGHKRVYGQMVTYEDRRSDKLFARYGFYVLDRVEVTKFRRSYPGRVFLSTVVRNLRTGPALAKVPRLRTMQGRTDA
jgi:L-amino acid N-acyltransferase YncA